MAWEELLKKGLNDYDSESMLIPMNQVLITAGTPPPPLRIKTSRLTQAMKDMKPGESFQADYATVRCYVSHAKYKGFRVTQKKVGDDLFQVWRLEG